MVTSAADPIKKRYTAGSCALEITMQPSALSQWSEQLVTNALTFRLWLAEGASTTAAEIRATKQLVAEGDHRLLKAIANYIQAKTRQTLAVSPLGDSLDGAPVNRNGTLEATASSSASSEAPVRPPEFRYPRPISYLQLCDLNTVLSQYQQSVLALPTAPAEQLGENVILLEPVRDNRVAPSPVQSPPRRRRRGLGWATGATAAALLLAVGVTTALRSRNPAFQELTTANNTAASDSAAESETDLQAEESTGDSLEERLQIEDLLQTERSADSALNSEGAQSAETLPPLPSSVPSSGQTGGQSGGPLPRTPTRPERSLRRDLASRQSLPVPPPATVPPATSAPTSPAPTATAPAISGGRSSAIAPSPPIPESSRDSLFAEQFETSASEAEPSIAGAERNAASRDNLSGDDLSSETFSGSDSVVSRSQTNPSQTSRPQAAGSESVPESVPESSPAPRSASPLVSQVQNYFQQRWQGGSETTLVYDLQLVDGSVAGFIAVNGPAEDARDHVLPSTNQPSFSTGLGAATLRVLLNGDGTVQVIQTR